MIPCLSVAACAFALGAPSANAPAPPVALVATPARVTLVGSSRQAVDVANTGSERIVVDVARTSLGVDLRGRPQILWRRLASRSAATWLAARPARLVLGPGEHTSLLVAATVPRRAEPGDHQALLLLTTRPLRRGTVAVRMRVGVVVVVRAPGRVVRKLALLRLHVRPIRAGRVLELWLANLGNVTETIGDDCLRLRLLRRGRVLASLRPAPRRFPPRTRGVVEFRYGGKVRGPVTAVVVPTGSPPCIPLASRRFPIRL